MSLSVIAHRIQEGKCQGKICRLFCGIGHLILEDGHRQTGIVHVERNKRGKGLERYLHRKRSVFEINLGDGIGSGELRLLEMAKPLPRFSVEAVPTTIRWKLWTFHHSHASRASFGSGPQGHKAKWQDTPLSGPV